MVSKHRHPKQPIAKAIKALDGDLFDVDELHKGHRWGVVTCTECGDTMNIFSTPKVPEDNASDIAKFAKTHIEKH
jgi:hypothetical protein